MKYQKVDYPYCTRVQETSEIEDSVKSEADVMDYYSRYGRNTFIIVPPENPLAMPMG
jgi:hypothetical protein